MGTCMALFKCRKRSSLFTTHFVVMRWVPVVVQVLHHFRCECVDQLFFNGLGTHRENCFSISSFGAIENLFFLFLNLKTNYINAQGSAKVFFSIFGSDRLTAHKADTVSLLQTNEHKNSTTVSRRRSWLRTMGEAFSQKACQVVKNLRDFRILQKLYRVGYTFMPKIISGTGDF